MVYERPGTLAKGTQSAGPPSHYAIAVNISLLARIRGSSRGTIYEKLKENTWVRSAACGSCGEYCGTSHWTDSMALSNFWCASEISIRR